ncbi:hypothetical protein PLICRDRAFT_172958 [Plicaturopsis crispa FD-325 SS-3]|nr:hypothetical protein PLICRDRAFT_172958 [Plicaturopsis crispa FD-325 SS-3]
MSIRRGLKPRYEVHHGAFVTAARYIYARFLPDKAIDLVDEAVNRSALAQESKRNRLQVLERQLMTLEVGRESLGKETDELSVEQAAEVTDVWQAHETVADQGYKQEA